MNIVFAGESFDCQHKEIMSHNVKLGDFVVLNNHVWRVDLNQRDCVSFDNLNYYFVQWTLTHETGLQVHPRKIIGKVEVFRPRVRKAS